MPDVENVMDLSRAHKTAAAAVAHAIRDLEAALSAKSYKPKGHVLAEMRRDFPYVIHATDTPGTQILVNRQYKPLGSSQPTGGEWARYEDFPESHVRLNEEQLKSLITPPSQRAFFGDGSAPWLARREANAYLRKLRLLLTYIKRSG